MLSPFVEENCRDSGCGGGGGGGGGGFGGWGNWERNEICGYAVSLSTKKEIIFFLFLFLLNFSAYVSCCAVSIT